MSPARGRPALPDAEARRRAVTTFDRNLVVVAGAGTGKTALLVERALNLIGTGRIPIAALVAITFSDKAAAELRQRLARGLDELRALALALAPPAVPPAGGTSEAARSYAWLRAEAGEEPRAIAERALGALMDLDAAAVSTIHAFCSEILTRHPREAGVDPGFAVDEGPGFERLFDEEWIRFLEEELGPRAGRAAIWRRALGIAGSLEAVRTIARCLASFAVPAEALGPDAFRARRPAEILGEEAGAALRALREAGSRASTAAPTMARFLASASIFLETFLESGSEAMASVAAPMSFAELCDRSLPDPGRKLSGIAPADLVLVLRRAHDLLKGLREIDEESIAAVAAAAAPLGSRCRERLLQAGLVSFDALLRLARDLLHDHPRIRRALASRYRAILVDEFQDTDPLQYEILFFIAEAEGSRAREANEARLEPGRLFIVGDPKQSIYHFRGADIEAYGLAVARVLACGGEELRLTASFRSPDEIVGPINRVFGAWIGRGPAGTTAFDPPYDPIHSARGAAGDAGPRVEIWSVLSAGRVAARRRDEGRAIAAWILRNASPASPPGDPRSLGSIAILMRALTHAGLYTLELQRAGIPFVVEGGKEFYERREVGDLLAFLRACASPSDGAAVLAVLRGPLGAVPDAEMARFVRAGGRLDGPEEAIDAAAFPALGRTVRLLGSFRRRMSGLAPDRIIEAALRETHLDLLHAASFDGAQRLANLRKLEAEAGALARRGLSLEEMLRAIEEEFRDEQGEGESPLADETLDAVRILSVHRAKGLEYPTVIIPDLGREDRPPASPGAVAAWHRGGGGLLAVRLKDGTINAGWLLSREARRRQEAAEAKRVFYVACTRAKERLILVNSSFTGSAPWRDALAPLGYSASPDPPPEGETAPGVRHLRITSPEVPPLETPRSAAALLIEAAGRFREAAASARASARPPFRWPAGIGDQRAARLEAAAEEGGAIEPEGPGLAGEAAPAAPNAADAAPDIARLAGAVVHAALERWDFRERDRLLELIRLESRRLAPAPEAGGAAAGATGEEAGRNAEAIARDFLASGLPERLARSEILGRELPILFRGADGTIWVGSCDLVYRDRDGTIVAADYKTDRTEGRPAAAAERYRSQVAVYVEALRRSLPGQPVRGEILFVRDGVVVPLEEPGLKSPGSG